jgi:ectoine hydroxylase-related dioxygenase (phytanoyl-CoA dioxygenase family)
MDKPNDRTPLPAPTRDVEQAKRDLDAFGLCLIAGALEGERLRRVRERLYSTAADDERLRARSAQGDYDTTNQRVWGLLNRGQEFVDLVEDPVSVTLVKYLLGWPFLLSSISANIAGPGHNGMVIHADQIFVPPPWPERPQGANCFWLVDDFTEENGGTEIAVASHRFNRLPLPGEAEAMFVPLVAPAGTMGVMDSRVWHRTGINRTRDQRRAGIFAWNTTPIYRTQENWFLSLNPLVRQGASDQLLWMLGYKTDTMVFGHVNGLDPL